jgi:CubicO group peptidase (beta-lactamase class C family)
MDIRYGIITIAVVAACSNVSRPQHKTIANATPASPPSALDLQIEQRMREGGLVGIGAAIIVDRRLVWTRGYGFANKQRAIPFTPDTVMNIASISKTFTGVALMRAVQEGKLSLDEDINLYLPFKVANPHVPDARITLRHIATHTSSITDRWSVYESTYHYGGDSPEPMGAFLESYFVAGAKNYTKENFLNVRPGTHRDYSNMAAALAGYIVERAVGEPLNTYTRRHIFAPLRMDRTGWFFSEIDPATHATLYVKDGILVSPIQHYGGTTYPDGGVRTSVADLSKFFIALLNEGEHQGVRILSKAAAREMLRFHFTESNKPDNVILAEKNSGIFWQSKYDVTRMGHGGTDPGLKTEMLADLSGQIGVILFSNTALDKDGLRAYLQIFEDLWNRAVALKAAQR